MSKATKTPLMYDSKKPHTEPDDKTIPAAELGRYCKAYQLSEFRKFPGWFELRDGARRKRQELDEKEVETEYELAADSILYLQENYIVTNGIFKNQFIVFDRVSPEWINFCHTELGFVPVYETETEEPPNLRFSD